ncbi:MAG: DnaB-like helicase C-terminal domain-containing protein, partial [Clostridia bacterium]|nr:DnaB-like helicase C-terminal domain-containing protein [Clostridia bacterium]
MLASEARVDSTTLRRGNLSPDDWVRLADAAAELSACEILLDDTTQITVTDMKAKLRRVKNLGLVVVDYLQLMQSGKNTDSRVQEVSDISRNLKLMAKELGVPIVCCAQLSRNPESKGRGSKRPMLSDLRDSGAIEQDADIILFLYRDDYYGTEEKDGQVAETDASKMEVIIAKNRHGGVGTVPMHFDKAYTRFYSIEKSMGDAPPA